ncbi:MAG: hypothetical protein AAFW69_11640 [Pseudomonadota bacterium]
MPLELLGPLVVLGILGVVALVHMTGGSARPGLAGPEHARAAFTAARPEAEVAEVELMPGGQAALVTLAGGDAALLWLMGDDPVVRELEPGILTRVEVGRRGLRLHLADFTAPRVEIAMADPGDRAAWAGRLSALILTDGTAEAGSTTGGNHA